MSASTQNQALAALLFLYQTVLEQDLPWLDDLVRAKRPHRIPVVLTRREVQSMLEHLEGTPRHVATLLYGAGLRLLEALQCWAGRDDKMRGRTEGRSLAMMTSDRMRL